jgi:hypothetical protein
VQDAVDVATIVAGITGVLSLILGIWLAYRGIKARNEAKKPSKLLRVKRLPYSSLTTIHPDIRGKITLTYDGKPVPSIGSVAVQLSNEGNSPIKREDFNLPLTFSFGENNQAIDAIQQTESGAHITEAVDPLQQPVDNVQISDKFLLNQTEQIELKFTVLEWGESAEKGFEYRGHIVDGNIQKTDEKEKRPPARFWFVNAGFFAIFFVGFFVLKVISGIDQNTEADDAELRAEIISGFGLIADIGVSVVALAFCIFIILGAYILMVEE